MLPAWRALFERHPERFVVAVDTFGDGRGCLLLCTFYGNGFQTMGISATLRESGVEEGDTVAIGAVELIWGYDNALEE